MTSPIFSYLISSFFSYLIRGTHQLNLTAFEGSLKYLGEADVDSDEIQCIIANLIDKVATTCISTKEIIKQQEMSSRHSYTLCRVLYRIMGGRDLRVISSEPVSCDLWHPLFNLQCNLGYLDC